MEILKRPLITEKMSLANEEGIYGFIVNKGANKLQIKEAVEELYNVQVKDVRTMIYQGKKKSRYTKTGMVTGRKASFKKAIVQLEEGEFIDFYGDL